VKDKTKKKILDVSISLFRRKGLVKTKVEDIVREAGISRATFYNYFHSKDEIFFCLIENETNRIQTRTTRAVRDESDPYVKLRIYLLEMIIGVREMIEELNVRHDEVESLPSVPKRLIESMMRRSANAIIEILDYGVQAGSFTIPNAELTAYVILSSLDVFINPFKLGEINKESVEKSVDELMVVLCFGLAKQPATLSAHAEEETAQFEWRKAP
jgi:AcrR family transcriptional regulator